jgi:hypothetical protein
MKDKLGIDHDEQSYLEIIRLLSKEQEPSSCLEYLWKMKQVQFFILLLIIM